MPLFDGMLFIKMECMTRQDFMAAILSMSEDSSISFFKV